MLYLLLLSGLPLSYGQCTTIGGGNCVFPFIFKGETYGGCTEKDDPDSKRWCSTMVDSEGKHRKGENLWGHCSSSCPSASQLVNPICGEIRITHQSDDFASGKYRVVEGRSHKGRAVYENVEKGLFLFWPGPATGWGIGYEAGLESGGTFYASGPQILGEPWEGSWLEREIDVTCDGPERNITWDGGEGVAQPNLLILQAVNEQEQNDNSRCTSGQDCLDRKHCPWAETMYNELLGLRKDSERAKEMLRELSSRVCHKKAVALCCDSFDSRVCKEGVRCLSSSECPKVASQLNTLQNGSLSDIEAKILYNHLESNICTRAVYGKHEEGYCCDGN